MSNKELSEKIGKELEKELDIRLWSRNGVLDTALLRMAEEKDKEINEAVHFIINEQKEQISELKAEIKKLKRRRDE